jgi:asparagine synthase (glutamine-hydrolysing)
MCGIAGCDSPDRTLVQGMMRLLAHRGPDQRGTFVDDSVALGHQRLSIIDLSERGKQPMGNKDGTSWIVFNGEIYNFRELRVALEKQGIRFNSKTDTEVLLNAYDAHGDECVRLFNGDFAFCIYDARKKQFILARDRLGVKPLYYFFDGSRFMFASEYKAFLAHSFQRTINRKALARYLTFRYNYGRETLLTNVHRVLPGEIITYDLRTKRLKFKRYWTAQFNSAARQASEAELARQLRALFEDSVRKRLMSDVPLGVFLSGGIDSGAIVAAMHHSGIKDISTFSIGFSADSKILDDDIRHARLLSNAFATNHHEYIVGHDIAKLLPEVIWHCDEPLADPALLPTWELARQAKKHATVILTGDGSDEVFAGYEQHKFLRLGQLPAALRMLGAGAVRVLPQTILNSCFPFAKQLGVQGRKRAAAFLRSPDSVSQYLAITSIFTPHERERLATGLPDMRAEITSYFKDARTRLQQAMRFELENALPENMLHKGDRMGLAHGVEVRVPFLDHRIVEFSSKLPDSMKLRRLTEKYILRRAMRPYLPKKIVQRKKQRFYVPIDAWIRNELRPLVDDVMSPTALREGGLIAPDAVRRLWNRYPLAPLFYARQLWTLLTLQLWQQQFIQGKHSR